MPALRVMLRPPEPVLRRHGAAAMAVHWLTVACAAFLLVTGLAMVPEGAAATHAPLRWQAFMRDAFGGDRGLLLAHVAVGWSWATGMLLLLVSRPRKALRFLATIFTVPPGLALRWTVRDNLRVLRGRGSSVHRGRYTPGQRMYAQAMVVGLGLATVSGSLMALPRLGLAMPAPAWALPLHSLSLAMSMGCAVYHAAKKICVENRGVPLSAFLLGGMPRSRAVRRHGLRDHERERGAQ